MDITQLFDEEDRAVSPVIGVILMVAITVILAAVIGSFVLGLGNSLQSTAPTANFQFEYETVAGNNTVTATHTGGDSIPESQLNLTAGTNTTESWSDDPVTAGVSAQVNYSTGDTVRVIWSSEDGGTTQTLAAEETPN
ncbi:type IV pilin [Halobaculum gomorrense]|uniref:Flagellin N-terminal-like domain-containing protein n=1 Tax=Halobaculum gomorrense TaxID=43928 RepID=A0A1M5PM69_9EURY|nr:type IV pilin N-terminal domain-containing protein [Halobaculum gomorrense]SHH02854.1 flagellin N-terminal-like domain-containing protein [Halobaculum gomorrense]